MADEVERANVIRVVRDGPWWIATIGPDLQRGLSASAPTAAEAIAALAMSCLVYGWVFDETWRPCGSL